MDNDVIVRLKDVSLERDEMILQNVNWEVKPGEHWAVLGANGCGKTTLLRLIARYQVASSGEVFVLQEGGEWQEVRKRIGFVSAHLGQKIDPRETAFEIAVSGRDAQLNYWGRISDDLAERARESLIECGAEKLIKRQWGNLSQGERQRVLVARALMNPLVMLVLDEPCAGLDPGAREEFLGMLSELGSRDDAPAIVLVTHHVEEVIPIFKKTMVLSPEGRVLASGSTEEALTGEVLSEAFGISAEIVGSEGRYRLELS